MTAPKKYQSPKMPPKFAAERNNETITDLLSMVQVDVPLDAASEWTDEQAFLAEHWAIKSYLRASDNNVNVPPMPDFLRQYKVVVRFVGSSITDTVRLSRGGAL